MTTIAQFASAHNVSLVDVAAHLDTSHGLTPDTELTINDLRRLASTRLCEGSIISRIDKVAKRLTAEGWKVERTPEGGLKTVASCGHPLTLDVNGGARAVRHGAAVGGRGPRSRALLRLRLG